MGHHQLDKLDESILKLVATNARIPFLEVARACNVSGAAIHQRIQKLTNLGVLKGSEFVIDSEKIGYETIGVRIPDNKLALKILNEVGPMLTTSVNDSGCSPMNEYDDIVSKYQDVVDEIYPPCGQSSNLSSTVISCVDGFKVLREGAISLNDILNV